ncbi:MAG: N-acetylglucosamine transferase [Betaproteobacteria bacterium]|nr:N-acetylglucosamine transferase [Betaproteobacteria bacterium]
MMFCRLVTGSAVILLAACAAPRSSYLTEDPACARIKALSVSKGASNYVDPVQAIRVLSECEAVSKTRPASARAALLRMRSIAFEQTKDYTKAIADSEEALRLQPPRTAWDVIGLAALYRDAGQPDRALVLLRKMLDDNLGTTGKGTTPGMPSYYHLGLTLLALEKWAEAAEAFTEGLTYQPDYAWAYFYRAVAYNGMRDTDRTRADLVHGKKLVDALNGDSRRKALESLRQDPFVTLMTKYSE